MMAHSVTAPQRPAKPREPPRKLFRRHQRTLPTRRVACLQFGYNVFGGMRCVIRAVPAHAGDDALELSEKPRQRLLRAFLQWMSSSQPEWTGGPDGGGVPAWDLAH